MALTSVGSFTTSFKRMFDATPKDYRTVPACCRQAVVQLRRPRYARSEGPHVSRDKAAGQDQFPGHEADHTTGSPDQDEALAFYTEKLGLEVRAT